MSGPGSVHAVRRARRSRGQRGSVAVEFALVLPLLVMLLLGVTTTGLVYSDHLAIANAAREGSRLGSAISYSSTTAPVVTPTQWADAVQQRVQQVYFNGGSTLSTNQVCVLLVDPTTSPATVRATPTAQGSCGDEPTSPSGVSAGGCIVKVWVQKPGRVELGVIAVPAFTIRAQSVSLYGRTAGLCTTP